MIKCVPDEKDGPNSDLATIAGKIRAIMNGENCGVSLAALASVFLLLLESASRDYTADTGQQPPPSWASLIAGIKAFEDERVRAIAMAVCEPFEELL